MQTQPPINIVWLKRDLRLRDHAPLARAIADGLPVLLLHCFEPGLMAAPEYDVRHWRFVYESLEDMQGRLRERGQRLFFTQLEVLEALSLLAGFFDIKNLYSHEEVGLKITFDRDKAVKKWCLANGTGYREFPQNGTLRGRKHRRGWQGQLEEYFATPPVQVDLSQLKTVRLPEALEKRFAGQPLPSAITTCQEGFQRGGETLAWRYFISFINNRKAQYSRQLSKPEGSRTACSRLSPYLAFGCISAREVMQATAIRIAENGPDWNLNNFKSRLWWRSHYVQKLESDWRVEVQPINPAFLQMDLAGEGPLLEAWRAGRTGFPMVDASMRCLHANGWVNFRMRAMLVTFAAFALRLDWRPVATHLARLFLDFDPGIHYPQIQMQYGLTGYNTLRIFNPAVQVRNHDPGGVFIKKWVPELQNVPAKHLAEPWMMTPMEQAFYSTRIGEDYPAPIVDYDQAVARNKAAYWALRQSPAAKAALPAVWETFCLPADVEKYREGEEVCPT
ncbi:MAG: deoxyribodipyrimidine photo-lyase [Lewinellaceae bacterium]|nr:deoxyribodipyrimidine photo-lyase [Saprospiraceae bacterium]MCB9336872.1 deoxyribodipyrimidine photo-lyase [Lewinellaceae bacterium]